MLADLKGNRPARRPHGSEVEESGDGRLRHEDFRFYFAIIVSVRSSVKHAKKGSRIVCG